MNGFGPDDVALTSVHISAGLFFFRSSASQTSCFTFLAHIALKSVSLAPLVTVKLSVIFASEPSLPSSFFFSASSSSHRERGDCSPRV